jgi:hypothetical protein
VKRLALLLCLVAALPSAASGAGCAPIDCAPSAVTLAHGRLLGLRPFGQQGVLRVVDLVDGRTRFRLPAGVLGDGRLVHQDGTLLTWFDAVSGRRLRDNVAPARFALDGLSTDGRRVVLSRTLRRSTTFAIVGAGATRYVFLDGHWSFDALSGSRLFLLQNLRNGYEVRLYDLAGGGLAPRPLKDGDESALIQGVAWERVASPDGRYLFTLYVGGAGETMIHELDLRRATARCIDLPGSGDFNSGVSYGLELAPDGSTLYAMSVGYGAVAVVDVHAARVVRTVHFAPFSTGSPVAAATAISQRGDELAYAVDARIWFYDAHAAHVRSGPSRVAIALGFSPSGRRLWYLGERSRVRSIPVS